MTATTLPRRPRPGIVHDLSRGPGQGPLKWDCRPIGLTGPGLRSLQRRFAMSDKSFAGQTVVVTGGGTGIGRAAALAFAELGAAHVIVTGRRAEKVAEVAALHESVVAVTADVTTEAGTQAVVDAVTARGGQLDVLVHNAGIFRFTPTDGLDPATARQVWDTNVVGPLLLTSRLLPLLRSPGASIVVVSSRAGHNASPGSSVYAASKAAVH